MPQHDVAVIGAGLGGMAAAALLARRGKKTALLEPAGEPGGLQGSVRRDAFRFSAGPSLAYGYEPDGVLHRFSVELGLPQPTSPDFAPEYQVILPDRRITVFAEKDRTLEELRREYPREIDRLVKCYRDVRKLAERCAKSALFRAFVRRRSASSFLRKFGFSRELTVFFEARSRVFFQSPVGGLPLSDLLRLIDSPPVFLRRGAAGLVEQLRDVFLNKGGEFMSNEPWPELLLRRSRITGVKTTRGDIAPRAALINAATREGEAVLFLAMQETAVPLEMAGFAVCVPDYAAPQRFFTLSVSSPDEASAPQGTRTVTAVFRQSAGEGEGLERVKTVIPFLSDFLLYSEFVDCAGRSYPLPEGLDSAAAGKGEDGPGLRRTSARNLYLLPDCISAPMRTIAQAELFARKIG